MRPVSADRRDHGVAQEGKMLRGLMFAAVVLGATPALAQQAPEPARKTRIAVLDVQSAGGGDRKTVEGLSALLASEVARRPSLTVIAGSDLRALLGFERQKQLLGCAEGSCIAELAGALGVAYLVTSEASKVGNTWLLSLALLDAKKAMAVNRLTRKAYTDDALVEETSKAVDELLAAMPGLTVVPASASVAVPPAAVPRPEATPSAGGAATPGYHRHDGFFLRFQAGGGGLRSSAGSTATTADRTFSGTAGTFGLAVGWAVVDNLVVLGEAFAVVDSKPTYTSGSQSVTADVSHSLNGYGLGVAYYLSPLNAYGELMVGTASTSLTAANATYTTDNGAIFRLGIGKEWWVTSEWGIGAGLNAMLGSMKAKGTDSATWRSTAFNVVLSATYN
jgi:TolB-like protein